MSAAVSDDDRRIIAEWRAGCSLLDVLVDYRTCDLFARHLVETGAGRGAYHAALFGYSYLNDLRTMNAGAERDELVRPYLAGGEYSVDCLLHVRRQADRNLTDEQLGDMFAIVAQCLAPGFERFCATMEAACRELVSEPPVTVTVRSARTEWRAELARAGELHARLAQAGLPDSLEPDFRAVYQGAETTVRDNGLVTVSLAYAAGAFRLTATLTDDAVAAHNTAVLGRLRQDRDTCCYLQLDDLVVLFDPAKHADPVLAFVRLGCLDTYGHAHPGLIERVGRPGPGRDYFVVHCPSGPSPRPVRTLVLANEPSRKVAIHPF